MPERRDGAAEEPAAGELPAATSRALPRGRPEPLRARGSGEAGAGPPPAAHMEPAPLHLLAWAPPAPLAGSRPAPPRPAPPRPGPAPAWPRPARHGTARHGTARLDLQFYCFLHYVTELNKDEIMLLFDLLGRNTRGRICFNEFYMVLCILLSHENHLGKQFIHRHVGPAFQLLDVDRDNTIDFNEFEATRFPFNIQKEELKIFKDFDISVDEQLSYREFKMVAVFSIDKQQQQ
ncbi:EF-hand calcium-binding domain-containing protein 9 [Nyctibius grandis]|uniref:EF-hand calcium-binding domain-containing protein 9 n=1 Tax=Nyctibius grandis TaxID=48427 RepID=UPI0035BC4EBF